MKKIILILLITSPIKLFAQFNVGFDFRQTQNFVSGDHSTSCTSTTTATICDIVISTSYPTSKTVNGSTMNVGWNNGITGNGDGNNAIDIRLAGFAYNDNTAPNRSFEVDLPSSGNYCVTFAMGYDTGGSQGLQHQKMVVYDTVSVLATIVGDTNLGSEFMDATGAIYSSANWPGNQAGITVNFSTTTAQFFIGHNNDGTGANSMLSFLGLNQGSCSAAATNSKILGPTKIAGPVFIK